MDSSLTKLRATNSNIDVQRDATIRERTCLTCEVDTRTMKIKRLEKEGLEWEVLGEAQKEHMDHLAFLLEPLMDKLPIEVVYEIQSLPGECSIEVEPKFCHTAIVPHPTDEEAGVDGAKLGNQL